MKVDVLTKPKKNPQGLGACTFPPDKAVWKKRHSYHSWQLFGTSGFTALPYGVWGGQVPARQLFLFGALARASCTCVYSSVFCLDLFLLIASSVFVEQSAHPGQNLNAICLLKNAHWPWVMSRTVSIHMLGEWSFHSLSAQQRDWLSPMTYQAWGCALWIQMLHLIERTVTRIKRETGFLSLGTTDILY